VAEQSSQTVLAPEVLDAEHWDLQYQTGKPSWDSDQPSTALRRVVAERGIVPCRTLEYGCGTGASAVWLAKRSFQVTAIDLSSVAIRRARTRAMNHNVHVRFLTGDLRDWDKLGGRYDFFFDQGCYHAVRLADASGYFRSLKHTTRPGTLGLVLVGNASEPEVKEGPPVVTDDVLRAEFGELFHIVALRRFRFDPSRRDPRRYLGWSCVVSRRGS
jgi:methyl halide transferase